MRCVQALQERICSRFEIEGRVVLEDLTHTRLIADPIPTRWRHRWLPNHSRNSAWLPQNGYSASRIPAKSPIAPLPAHASTARAEPRPTREWADIGSRGSQAQAFGLGMGSQSRSPMLAMPHTTPFRGTSIPSYQRRVCHRSLVPCWCMIPPSGTHGVPSSPHSRIGKAPAPPKLGAGAPPSAQPKRRRHPDACLRMSPGRPHGRLNAGATAKRIVECPCRSDSAVPCPSFASL